jgi:hypothetical protein
MTKHELAEQFEMQTLPPLPDGVHFRPVKVEALSMPHPYCITPKHLELCDSMYLNEDTIRRAEERGARCGVSGCQLSCDEHETSVTLFVEVPDNSAAGLNQEQGLLPWLNEVKDAELGLDGFAFPAAGGDR